MTDPFAAQPHPLGLAAVPAAQAVFDAELDDAARDVAIPPEAELKEWDRPDLAELADRLGLGASGSKKELAGRIEKERKRRSSEASKPSE